MPYSLFSFPVSLPNAQAAFKVTILFLPNLRRVAKDGLKTEMIHDILCPFFSHN